jgi:hypothetical protein
MTSTKEQIGAVLSATGTHTLGALVFWTLSSARIPRAVFRERLEALGLDHAMSKDPSPRGALSKAVPTTLVGKKGIIARRLPKDTFALVLEQVVDGVTLKLTHVASVSTKGDQLHVEYLDDGERLLTEAHPAFVAQLGVAYHDIRTHLFTPDLSEILSVALNGSPFRGLFAGISLRERTGGLFFVAGAHLERLHKFRALIEEFAPHCVINVMAITGNQENLEQTARAARSSFASQLQDLKDELHAFHAELDGKSASSLSISTRVDKYRELGARVNVFRDVLGALAGELDGQIETAKKEMLKLLEGV